MTKPLSDAELALWRALKEIGEATRSLLAGEIGGGISAGDFGVLSRLDELGGGSLGQGALRSSLNWDKSRLSHQLTRMEARRLLSRSRERGAKAVTISILPTGRRLLARARPLHARTVRAFLSKCSAADAAVLLRLARQFADAE